VVINQNNLSQKNTGEIYQNGDNNANTTISQSNNSVGNQGMILQGFTSAGVVGTASNGNQASITQQGNSAAASSSFNEANIRQTGSSNQSTIDQSATAPGGSSRLNLAGTDQLGNTNVATVQQLGGLTDDSETNAALINQTDNGNQATVQQNGGSNGGSSTNEATITQTNTGISHQASISQNDNSRENNITVTGSFTITR